MERGAIMIDTEGSVVGQINALSVYSMGDITFGKPSRITCRTFLGRHGIINIERESQLSGVNHVVLESDCEIQGAGWSGGNRRITVCYLDDDPLVVADAIRPVLEARWRDAPVRPVHAGPLETVVPYQWDWFD